MTPFEFKAVLVVVDISLIFIGGFIFAYHIGYNKGRYDNG
jgi:hypothetical protein